ncbi:MAG: hypothetical protein LBJ11_07010 [Oscillospiraceae bacterium]|nr:hypothetical protein [Oscillospiraceae bacterium]
MLEKTFHVTFYDAQGGCLRRCKVRHGRAAKAPEAPSPPEGWQFERWEPQVAFIMADACAYPVYRRQEHLVTFLSETGAVLKQELVLHGQDASPPYYSSGRGSAAWDDSTADIRASRVFRAVFP